MSQANNNKFHKKSFTSFITLFSFLIMTISGIFLYFAPPGRIANWSRWTFLFLTKAQWQAIHTILSLVFIIASGFHIYFNWSVLIGYIKRKMQQGINKKRELLWSSVLTVLLSVFTIAGVPPFSTIMDWGEELSNAWSNEQTEPPIPHAEAMTLEELAKLTQQPLDGILRNLNSKGIMVDSTTMVVKELAQKYHLTPNQLYEKMQIKIKNSTSTISGRGFGRKTVTEICQQHNIPVRLGLERLKENNIEAGADNFIRDLAQQNNKLPVELIEIITGTKLEHE